jgi:hypothetical protein
MIIAATAALVTVVAVALWLKHPTTDTKQQDTPPPIDMVVPSRQPKIQPEIRPDASLAIRDTSTAESNSVDEQLHYRLEKIARDLASPDGLAIHPKNGMLFVSEETPSRISVIRDGPRAVIDRKTPVMKQQGSQRAKPMINPEGIAFAPDGTLYAVEDIPGGRLLRFPEQNGKYPRGYVEPFPGNWSRFAWEGVAVSDKGEILICGSDLESADQESGLTPYTGIILYRDEEHNWWVPYERVFASFSGVGFSKHQKYAVYTEEVMGTIGWLDLSTRQILGGNSLVTAKSPEGICVLPDGTFLITEEGGTVMRLDPATDEREDIVSGLGGIESVIWDAGNHRAVVSADGTGQLLALWPDRRISSSDNAIRYAPFYPTCIPQHVPRKCPEYLVDVLAMGGLNYERRMQHQPTFREFTARVPLVAADAVTQPVLTTSEVTNPIERVQFVIFNPNKVMMNEDGTPSLPLAAFAAVKTSGEMIRTSLMKVESYFSSFESAGFEPMDLARVTVPHAGPVAVSSLGIATIHLLGLGQADDYSLVLNPRYNDDSYMVVYTPDGERTHYKLLTPQGTNQPDSWVIALADKPADTWALLGKPALNEP